jgi:5-dehydro-2-deoxygluconokinase
MKGPQNLDLVCIGRTSVDLYAEQEGARLEDVQAFRKYVGGSATNIAVGTARLGVKGAMLTRVGNEQMGRFVRKTLAENGVDLSAVRFDPENLTPYVLLAVREIEGFPRIFAYGDAADLALEEGDVDPDFIASAWALLVTGTPLSRAGARAASLKAIRAARGPKRASCSIWTTGPCSGASPRTSRVERCSSPARRLRRSTAPCCRPAPSRRR